MKQLEFVMVLFSLILALSVSSVTGLVLTGNWTWLSGSDAINQKGIYGTQGVTSDQNRPSARFGHSMVMDPTGKRIFVFGGYGYDASVSLGQLNDMWMFSITSGRWTWLSGSDTREQLGKYGTPGIASLNNVPGARSDHSMVIHPSGQSIFVFGGWGYDSLSQGGDLNDLWMYDLTSGWWTWLSGADINSQVGIYGTQGVTAAKNRPGARCGHSMVMHPTGQQLIVFGGYGFDSTTNKDSLNDMWMFNLSSGWWTWLNGADPTNQRGVYVLQGVASVTNQPGARQFHSMVMHPSGGLMFLFGGYHNDYAAEYFNDLWMFNLTSGWWTWLSGSNTTNQRGVYGLRGIASMNNQPGARQLHSMVMHPTGQLLFVFGGNGYASSGSTVHLNDMWIFNLTSAWWSWINGSDTINQVGIYGIRGEASASNRPGTRHGHSMVIHPSGQALFLFGGEGRATSTTLGNLNDMWMFYSPLLPNYQSYTDDKPPTLFISSLLAPQSQTTIDVSMPTQKPVRKQTPWWLTIGPLYGFLILFFVVWILFMIGILFGYVYERGQPERMRTSTDHPVDSEASFATYSTNDSFTSSSYGTTMSSDPPTLVASTHHQTTASSYRYHASSSFGHASSLGDAPTLVAPSTIVPFTPNHHTSHAS